MSRPWRATALAVARRGLKPSPSKLKPSPYHFSGVGVDPIAGNLVGRGPRHCLGVRSRHRITRRRQAQIVDDDEVIADAAVGIAMHAVEGFNDCSGLDGEPRLLQHFTPHGIDQGLSQLDDPSWQRPLAFAWLVATLDDERPVASHHDGANADHRMRGVFSGHMKSHTEYLTFAIPARMAFENITPKVAAAVRKSGVREGLVLVNAMHITASVFINDDESGLHKDYATWLEQLAPFDASPARYAHNRTGEDNADAHMKRQIMGREVVVAITGGELDFGPWEQIFYGEFDGNRPKRVLVKVIGE